MPVKFVNDTDGVYMVDLDSQYDIDCGFYYKGLYTDDTYKKAFKSFIKKILSLGIVNYEQLVEPECEDRLDKLLEDKNAVDAIVQLYCEEVKYGGTL